MKRKSTSSVIVFGASGLLLLGLSACASSTRSPSVSEKKLENHVAIDPNVYPTPVTPQVLSPGAVAFAPHLASSGSIPPSTTISHPTSVAEEVPVEEEVSEEEKRRITYLIKRAVGMTTILDPRDVDWLKNLEAKRAKAPAKRLPMASLPPEDEGKLWDKNIPAERAKIKDTVMHYRKALGLPIDDASLEEAVNRTTTEITPVDREGNPISLK